MLLSNTGIPLQHLPIIRTPLASRSKTCVYSFLLRHVSSHSRHVQISSDPSYPSRRQLKPSEQRHMQKAPRRWRFLLIVLPTLLIDAWTSKIGTSIFAFSRSTRFVQICVENRSTHLIVGSLALWPSHCSSLHPLCSPPIICHLNCSPFP